MDVDLFLKRVPQVVKSLIEREASENRRSINQEAIALLEEALLQRVESHQLRRRSLLQTLQNYATAKDGEALLGPDGEAPKQH